MPAAERALDRARLRGVRLLIEVGRDIHNARVTHGLSQATTARAIGVAQSQLSEIERGRHRSVSVDVLARLAAAVGLDLSMRLYPAGQPIRDRAHLELFKRFRAAIGGGWAWAHEVPLPIPGDQRAWDLVLRRDGVSIGVEGETRPTDVQDLARRVSLKRRDGGIGRVILLLADTEWCRRLVRISDLELGFPVSSNVALRLLAEGRDPGGDAVILI